MSTPPALPYAVNLDEPTLSDAQRRRGLVFLGLAVGAVGFTMALQMGLNANFLREEIGIDGFQMGLIESIRESCGIVAFALLALLAGLAEPLIGAAMLLLVAAGLGAYAYAPGYVWVVLLSVAWSQGLHIWMPLPNSMALALAEPGRAGHRLGQLAACGTVGGMGGFLTGILLTRLGVPIRPLYLLAGVAAVAGAALCLGIPRKIKTPGPRLVFRRRYGLYYLLNFLEGWRKQIFVAFAAFLLVARFGTPVWVILLLSGLVQGIGYFTAPAVGKLIDRVGERRVLTFYYACLTVFFVGYATLPNEYALYVLYVIDNAFFVFAMALTTYVNRIAPRSEHTATLSMGVATNHVASVAMPLVGGLLWAALGYQATFLVGAAAAAISIAVVQFVPRHPTPSTRGFPVVQAEPAADGLPAAAPEPVDASR